VEENIAYNAFLVGKNLVGMRVADVLKAVAKVRGDAKDAGVVLCGRRDSALVACCAAALDPTVRGVAVEEMALSFWPLFEAEGRAINAASIVPRLLRDYGDVAAVLAAVAPRKVLAAAPTGRPERRLDNLERNEKRLTANPEVLLDWLGRCCGLRLNRPPPGGAPPGGFVPVGPQRASSRPGADANLFSGAVGRRDTSSQETGRRGRPDGEPQFRRGPQRVWPRLNFRGGGRSRGVAKSYTRFLC
jgi:hypothetical protein